MPPRANDVPRPPLMRLQFAGRLQVIAITGRSYRLRNRAGAGQAGQAGQGGHGGGSEGGQAGEAAGPDGLAAQEREGRRSTAGSEGFSPPEDTKIHPPVSSDGESDEQAEAPITTNAKTGRRHAR